MNLPKRHHIAFGWGAFRDLRRSRMNRGEGVGRYDECGWCHTELRDTDTVNLAWVEGKGNFPICIHCTKETK